MIGADASAAIVRSCRCVPRNATEITGLQRNRRPNLAPDDVADRLESATPDRDTAVGLSRPGTPSRDYQPTLPASLVKSP
jgi:hypothetical protein